MVWETMSGCVLTTDRIRQNFAENKGNTLPLVSQQNPAVEIPYRTQLAANLVGLMAYRGVTPETIKATYLDGTKKGKAVAIRTIRPIMNGTAPSTGLDVLAALAEALKVQVYHLFVPELDPLSQPPAQAETWIESEVERRLAARLRLSKKANQVWEAADGEGPAGRPSGKSPFIDSPASIGSTPSHIAIAKQAAKKAAAGSPKPRARTVKPK